MKPGGYLLAFSAARTYHLLASNIELAGFEIRDQLMWLYASGFPKAQDIGKAIQKRLGVEETTVVEDNGRARMANKLSDTNDAGDPGFSGLNTVCTSTLAKQWEGFKTSLKPAHEPIVMARKPFKGSTIDNVLKNGLGAMNIDATRVPWADEPEVFAPSNGSNKLRIRDEMNDVGKKKKTKIVPDPRQIGSGPAALKLPGLVVEDTSPDGRYPSNVIGEVEEGYQKYFYCPKVSRKERHSGFEMPEALTGHIKGCYAEDGSRMAVGLDAADGYRGNNHPTVKPVALMDYLIKLVTPPSTPGLQRKVLDPFMGSGSTGMAAVALGHHFTGCELDSKYVAIANTRIEAWNAVEEVIEDKNDDFDRMFGT